MGGGWIWAVCPFLHQNWENEWCILSYFLRFVQICSLAPLSELLLLSKQPVSTLSRRVDWCGNTSEFPEFAFCYLLWWKRAGLLWWAAIIHLNVKLLNVTRKQNKREMITCQSWSLFCCYRSFIDLLFTVTYSKRGISWKTKLRNNY